MDVPGNVLLVREHTITLFTTTLLYQTALNYMINCLLTVLTLSDVDYQIAQ